jgi:hypothetical protein
VAGVLASPSSALAQTFVQPAAEPQTQMWMPRDDGTGDASALSGYRALAPLRLSLEASLSPKAGGFPNCVSREDAVGNSVGGIPVQRSTMLRLTPRLVLSGFTQLGCPIDAGLGAALTYALPVSRSSWLVFGGGVYGAPGQAQLFGGLGPSMLGAVRGTPSPVSAAGRIDLVWKTRGERTFNVGVQALAPGARGVQSVLFGGGF